MNKPIIKGQMNPQAKAPAILTKEEITFELDEDGKAIPQEVSVEVYDRAYDDEIFGTTLELDNALNLNESTSQAYKKLAETQNKETTKLTTQISDLEKLEKKTNEQNTLLIQFRKKLKDIQDNMAKLTLEYETRMQMINNKIKETRKDLKDLEELRKEKIEIRLIKAIPCTVTEAYKYFHKRSYKDDKGVWVEPTSEDDNTYISHLLSEKVIEPKLTIEEWDMAKPQLRLSIKETISEISYYTRPSPREVLVERRRSEKIKNIIGDC